TQPHMMRIELRLEGSKGIPDGKASGLSKVKNRWGYIYPVAIADLAKAIPALADPMQLEAVKQYGLHVYLQGLSRYKRTKYRKALQELPTPAWWNPDVMWQECLQAVKDAPFISLTVKEKGNNPYNLGNS
ncbi:MAG: hypothetical protein WAZ18_07645, partial [Alphaproteobacteria bacterium]